MSEKITIDSATVAGLIGVKPVTIRQWIFKDMLPRPEVPNAWDGGEILAALLFRTLLGSNRGLAEVRREVATLLPSVGEFALAQLVRPTGAPLTLVRATFADDAWLRLLLNRDDVPRLIAAALRRKPIEVQIIDATEAWERVLAKLAFRAARPERARSAAPAEPARATA